MRRRRLLQTAALGAARLALSPAVRALAAEPDAPRVRTETGTVVGYWADAPAGRRVAAFKGIPYGADTRTTRFQPPRPAAPWAEPKVCIAWPTRAPQMNPQRAESAKPLNENQAAEAGLRALFAPADEEVHFHLPPDQGEQSEDCLYLNVWTPSPAHQRAKLPVLVYLHGGAYNGGTVNAELYDGTRLASRDAVVVTVNHRLNAFGFLELAELPGLRERYRESGNVGMLDLVLALRWVRANIARFGGDPGRVTIFGQSGGGAKCATLMAMEAARGLFQRVLTMSGQQVWGASMVLATGRAEAALAAMGLSGEVTAEKLDGLTTGQIQAGARTSTAWMPVVDGAVLLRDPFSPDAPPMSDGIPMILGNTRDEILGAQAWRQAGLTWQTLPAALGRQIEAFRGPYTVQEIIAAYRKWYPQYSPVDVWVRAVAAFRSWPGQVMEAEARARNLEAARHTWVYQMDWPSPTADGRSPHTVDLAFVFDNLRLSPGMVGASEEQIAAAQPLATAMSDMLLAYARTGNPNCAAIPHWPVYGPLNGPDCRETMLFNTRLEVVSDPRGQERRLVEQAHYRQPGT